jgi:hypothetical protein
MLEHDPDKWKPVFREIMLDQNAREKIDST